MYAYLNFGTPRYISLKPHFLGLAGHHHAVTVMGPLIPRGLRALSAREDAVLVWTTRGWASHCNFMQKPRAGIEPATSRLEV